LKPYQLKYFDEVENDLQEAKLWYQAQQMGLEDLFAASVLKTIEDILEFPKIYAIRYKKIRIAYTKNFPYGIHFYVDESTAIVHQKKQLESEYNTI
jgi:hypothetical protein